MAWIAVHETEGYSKAPVASNRRTLPPPRPAPLLTITVNAPSSQSGCASSQALWPAPTSSSGQISCRASKQAGRWIAFDQQINQARSINASKAGSTRRSASNQASRKSAHCGQT